MVHIHSDHLNTPKVVTDRNQQVVWKADYQPFGEAEPTVTTLDMPLRFPGQYADQETGLNYNYFRSYDSATGHYTQSDPIGLVGGLNRQAYVGASPIMFVDTVGLKRGFPGDEENICLPWPSGITPYNACVAGCQAAFGRDEERRHDWYYRATEDCSNSDVFDGKRKATSCLIAVEAGCFELLFFSLKRRDKCLDRCSRML